MRLITLLFATISPIVYSVPQASGPTSTLTIQNFSFGGTGCPQYTNPAPTASVANGNTQVVINYNTPVSVTGNTAFGTRKICTVAFTISGAAGWKWSVTGATYAGTLTLPTSNNGGNIRGNFYDPNGTGNQLDTVFVYGDTLPRSASTVGDYWSSCGVSSPFSFKTTVNATSTAGRKNPPASTISLSGAQTFNIKWEAC